MMHYNKLIRDRIPEKQTQDHKQLAYHQAGTDQEYWFLLKSKMQEEMTEFVDLPTPERLADIYDVLQAISDFKNFDAKDIQAIRENRQIEDGGFTKRWVLEMSEEPMGEDTLDQLT